ncbi:MAG TPA: Fic family protein [Candidatus Limnocylindria bacterium]|nr:Fic family protein [Candidatus Limnocylindria bacterium]
MVDPKKPFNNLPTLPPKSFLFDDSAILKASMSASQAIASLNATIRADVSNVNHSLNMMSPLYVPEAVTSSGVENIITTNERVYEARLLDENDVKPQDKEVMRYVEALAMGIAELDKRDFLATNQYIAIQKTLEPSKTGIRKIPGTQLSNPKTGQIYYTPPDNEQDIRRLLKNFEEYFNEEAPKHEIFARAALLHYQFEAIHPFHDGNGRTGRMLIPLYLTKQNVLDAPLLFVSKFILENRDNYYKLLRNVTFKEDWKSWVLYMLEAFERQAEYTLAVLGKIDFFKKKLEKKLNEVMGHAYAHDITQFLYKHPFFTQAEFEGAVDVSYVTARKYLKLLETERIVAKKRQAKRNRYIYTCPEYIVLLKKS